MTKELLNNEWILTKWSTDVNAMAEYEVRITAIIDGPNGHDWVVGEGWGLAEFTMPLEHFLKQARPMEILVQVGPQKEAVRAFMDELVA